jgi:TP901 family phage tail tape measure protein
VAFKLNLGTLGLNLALDAAQFMSGMSGAKRMVASFSKIAAKAAAVGVGALSAGLVYSVKKFAKFEQAIMNATAVSGEGMKAFDQLKAAAMSAAAGSMFSATEAGKALEYLGLAGFNSAKSIAALPGVLQLATAAQIDLGKATDIATDTLTGFGLKATDITRVNDVLVKTFTSSNTTLLQLGEAMSYVAPVARGLEQDIETTSAALGLLADVGIKASEGGTMLRGVMLRLAAPTGKSAAALEELGVSMFDNDGLARDLVDVFDDLAKATDNLSSEEATAYMREIFGMRNIAGAEALIDTVKRAEKGFRSYRDELREANGEAGRVATMMSKTVSGASKMLKGNVENLAITFGQFFGPALYNVAVMLGDTFKRLVSTDDGFENMRRTAVNVLKTLAGMLRLGGQLGLVLSHVVGIVAELAEGFYRLGLAIDVATAARTYADAWAGNDILEETAALQKLEKARKALNDRLDEPTGQFHDAAVEAGEALNELMKKAADETERGAEAAAQMTREELNRQRILDKIDRAGKNTNKNKGGGAGKATSPLDAAMAAARGFGSYGAGMGASKANEAARELEERAKKNAKLLGDSLDMVAKLQMARDKARIADLKEQERQAKQLAKAQEQFEQGELARQDTMATVADHLTQKALGVITTIFGPGFEEFVGAMDSAFQTAQETFKATGSKAAAIAAGLADAALSLVGAFAATEQFQQGMDAVTHAMERTIGKFDPLGWVASHLEGAFGAVILTFEKLAEAFPEMGGLSNELARAFFDAGRGLISMILFVGEMFNRISQGFNWLMAAIVQIPLFLANMVNGIIEFFGGDALIVVDGMEATIAGFEAASANAAATADKLGAIRESLDDMTYTDATTAFNKEVTDMADNMSELNDELRNAPSGFKTRLAALRYGADEGVEVAAGTGGGGGGSTTVHINAMGMRASELVQAMQRRSIIRSGSSQVVESQRYGAEYAARRFA